MTRATAALATILIASSALLYAAPPKSGPEIFSLAPDQGPAGQEIELKGSGLSETRHVYFCVGHKVREAKFKVVSDQLLQLNAPPFFQSGLLATVVVQTQSGVTVGLPASTLTVSNIANHPGNANSFSHVLKKAVLSGTSGSVLIEEGGAADAPSSGLCFVKNGGTLLNVHGFRGLVFHEPQARVQAAPANRQAQHPQHSHHFHHSHHSYVSSLPFQSIVSTNITASAGIEPFLYQRPQEPDEPAKSAPKVTTVAPAFLRSGEVITLRGSGFLQTQNVYVIHAPGNAVLTVGHHVVSDTQLEFELPDRVVGSPLLLIVNPKGATLALSPIQTMGTQVPSNRAFSSVDVVAPGTVITKGSGSRNYLIENGGTVANTGSGCNVFVLKGGNLSLNSGSKGLTVFCENEADIEQGPSRSGQVVHQVGPLSVSILPTAIQIAGK